MEKELLIFGANGALGIGITESLLNKDFSKIYLFDFNIDSKLSNNNVETVQIKDLSKEENVKEALNIIKPGKDKILFLYSTIGGFAGGNFVWETQPDEFDKMINMNVKTNYFLAKHFSNLIKNSAGGSICFTAALSGLKAEEKKSSYGISKAALIHLVKELALEGKKINLSVNAIAPYIIDTPANREGMSESDFSKWIKPKEIGELVGSIFNNFHFISGNILTLTNRFEIK